MKRNLLKIVMIISAFFSAWALYACGELPDSDELDRESTTSEDTCISTDGKLLLSRNFERYTMPGHGTGYVTGYCRITQLKGNDLWKLERYEDLPLCKLSQNGLAYIDIADHSQFCVIAQ